MLQKNLNQFSIKNVHEIINFILFFLPLIMASIHQILLKFYLSKCDLSGLKKFKSKVIH